MNDELHITFVDVGQGDSTLVRLPTEFEGEKSAILIDCPSGKSQVILDLLKEHNIDHLALVIVTHSDDDHCGGISDILAKFADIGKIGQVVYIPDSPSGPSQRKSGRGYRRFARLTLDLETKGKLSWWRPNLDIRNYGDISINFLHPDERDVWIGLVEQDRNSVSQVISLEYAGIRVLFAADITEKGWGSIVKRIQCGNDDAIINLKSQVVKVPHHGGSWQDTEGMKAMFNLLQPEYIVISVGSNNTYDHPSSAVFNALSGVPTLKRILCTQATPHRCNLAGEEAYSCAGSVEIILKPESFHILPDERQHLSRIRAKKLNPACLRWLRI